MIKPTKEVMVEFVNWMTKNDIVLSYWNEAHQELMPITYTVDSLIGNFNKNKPGISGKVKRVL